MKEQTFSKWCLSKVFQHYYIYVYVCSLEKWLLRQSLLPCYRRIKTANFTKRLKAATKGFESSEFRFQVVFFNLNAVSFECSRIVSMSGRKTSPKYVGAIYPFWSIVCFIQTK